MSLSLTLKVVVAYILQVGLLSALYTGRNNREKCHTIKEQKGGILKKNGLVFFGRVETQSIQSVGFFDF
jgi:hypothetical protein